MKSGLGSVSNSHTDGKGTGIIRVPAHVKYDSSYPFRDIQCVEISIVGDHLEIRACTPESQKALRQK